jgi:hypothetical protein
LVGRTVLINSSIQFEVSIIFFFPAAGFFYAFIMNDFELIEPTNIENLLKPTFRQSVLLDLFHPCVLLGKGTLYRTWHVGNSTSLWETSVRSLSANEGVVAKISLRFNLITSVFVIIIDGEPKIKAKLVFDSERKAKIIFKFADIDFELYIKAKLSKMTCDFRLLFSGNEIKALNEPTISPLSRTSSRSSSNPPVPFLFPSPTSSMDYPFDSVPRDISIPSLKTCYLDKQQKKVVIRYQIISEIRKGEKMMVEKRFSDFVILDKLIKGHFPDDKSIPRLPKKIYNPFIDQTSDGFLFQRRKSLEDYLNTIISHDKVRSSLFSFIKSSFHCALSPAIKISPLTEVLCFLGLDPITCTPLDQSLLVRHSLTIGVKDFFDNPRPEDIMNVV